MKATAKKILITVLAIIITATIAYAKVSCKRMVSEGAFYNPLLLRDTGGCKSAAMEQADFY
jgi:hypothetical protein